MRRLVYGLLLVSLFSFPVFAQEDTTEDTEDTTKLGKVVVTGTRTELKKENVTQNIQVITSKDIEKSNAIDITGILKKSTGVDIIEYPGALSGIGMRGFRPEYSGTRKHTLLLVNGRPAGATNLATLPLNNVERIEVLKGPASSLYGSQAMGGVINVITKTSKRKIQSSATIGAGSYNKIYGKFNSGGALADLFDYDFSAQAQQQRGDIVMGDDKLSDNFSSFQNGEKRANTTYKKYNSYLRLGKDVGIFRFDISGNFTYGDNVETPGDIEYGDLRHSYKDMINYNGDLKVSAKVTDGNTVSASVFNAREAYETTSYYGKISGSYVATPAHTSYASQIDYLGGSITDTQNIIFGSNSLTAILGIDYNIENTEAKSYDAYGDRKKASKPNTATTTLGVFTQLNFNFFEEKVILDAGIRYDRIAAKLKDTKFYTSIDTSTTVMNTVNPSAGFKVKPLGFIGLEDFFNVHSTVGTAFVAPNGYELSGDFESGSYTVSGNSDIDPEKSLTYDVGMGFDFRQLGFSCDITYYHTDVEDKIIQVKTGASTKSYENADSAEMSGIEGEFNFNVGQLLGLKQVISLFGTYTHTIKAEETESGVTTDIQNVADKRITAGIDYDDNELLSMRLSGRYVGEMKDTDWVYYTGEIEYPDFWVVDCSVGFKIGDMQKINIKVGNVFDKYYYEKKGYTMPGRNISADYTISF